MDHKAKEVVKKLKEKRGSFVGMWGIDLVKLDLSSIITAVENGKETVRLRLSRWDASFSFLESIVNQAGAELIDTQESNVFAIIISDEGLELRLEIEGGIEEDYGLGM